MITNSAPGFQTGMATLLLLLMSGSVFGQTHDPEALAAARAGLQAERQEVRLTESESSSFWPIYENYRRDMMQVRDRRVEMISGYLQAYNSGELSDYQLENKIDAEIDVNLSDMIPLVDPS